MNETRDHSHKHNDPESKMRRKIRCILCALKLKDDSVRFGKEEDKNDIQAMTFKVYRRLKLYARG